MTTFQYMGGPYISSEILLIENAIVEYKSDKAKDFVLVFAICIAVSTVRTILQKQDRFTAITPKMTNLFLAFAAEHCLHDWMLLVHQVPVLSR